MDDFRAEFPWLSSNPHCVYADSAATTLKPRAVVAAVGRSLVDLCANPGRGTYRTSTMTTTAVENVRQRVGEFIGAARAEDIAFTSGATSALNAFVRAWGPGNLEDGDAVLVSSADHQANVAPWRGLQQRLARQGVHIELVDFALNESGDASVDDVVAKCTSRVKLIALTHIHNVFGDQTLVRRIRNQVRPDVRIVLDGAQSVGHIPVDVQRLGIDALAFSGHKMFSIMGTGVLWASTRMQEELSEVCFGGHSTGRGGMAALFEAGTPNVPGILSLGAAIDFIEDFGLRVLEDRIAMLTAQLVEGLQHIDGVEFLPGVAYCPCKVGYGISSFRVQSQSAADVGFMLDSAGISVRTGSHCSGDPELAGDSVRVSLHAYNTTAEVDRILSSVAECAA